MTVKVPIVVKGLGCTRGRVWFRFDATLGGVIGLKGFTEAAAGMLDTSIRLEELKSWD